jgi:hypothetical protein
MGNIEVQEVVTQLNGEVYELVTKYAQLSQRQEMTLEIFWRALLIDLRAQIAAQSKAA